MIRTNSCRRPPRAPCLSRLRDVVVAVGTQFEDRRGIVGVLMRGRRRQVLHARPHAARTQSSVCVIGNDRIRPASISDTSRFLPIQDSCSRPHSIIRIRARRCHRTARTCWCQKCWPPYPVIPMNADGTLGPRSVWAGMQDWRRRPLMRTPTMPRRSQIGSRRQLLHRANGSGRVLVVGDDKKLVRIITVPTPYVTNMNSAPMGPLPCTSSGVFDPWKAPFPGACIGGRNNL